MNKTIAVIAAAGALGLGVAAQEKKAAVAHQETVVFHSSHASPHPATGVRIVSMHSAAVKGAPYSAETITESVQTLADGNRITHTSKGMQYRDSEGRTRMDNVITPLAMWVPEGKEQSISNINDPVSGEHYMLDHTRKVVVKSSLRHIGEPHAAGAEARDVRVEVKRRERSHAETGAVTFTQAVPAPPGDVLVGPGPAVMVWQAEGKDGADAAMKKESLGKRTIEGVECEGTRETLTIEAGRIGNDRPIQTVTERWYSARLQQDVLRTTTDPRFGEMTYKLTRISQAEQPRSLFEAPADYKVEDEKIQFIKQRTAGKE